MCGIEACMDWGLFLSALKTKLFCGVYGPVIAVSHKSGLGSTFDGVSPVCGDRVSPAIAKCERVVSWQCPSPPGTACLVHGKMVRLRALSYSSWVLQRGEEALTEPQNFWTYFAQCLLGDVTWIIQGCMCWREGGVGVWGFRQLLLVGQRVPPLWPHSAHWRGTRCCPRAFSAGGYLHSTLLHQCCQSKKKD